MQKTPDFMPEFKANLPRTSHVLSHDFGFTATTGHLNPIFHTIVSPGDTVKLGFNYQLRTMPLASAAFGDLICHTEYFFVPMQLLYQPFDNVFFGINNLYSSWLGTPGDLPQSKLPLLNFTSLTSYLYTHRADPAQQYANSLVFESVGQSAIRLFDLLGYCPLGIAFEDSEATHFYQPNVFPYPILAYNCIYQYYYRLDSRERFNPRSFNWDINYQTALCDISDYDPSFVRMYYRPLNNDYFTDIKVSPIVDVLNLNNKSNLSNVNSWLTRPNSQSPGVNVFPTLKNGTVGSDGAVSSSPTFKDVTPSNSIITNFGFTSESGSSDISVLSKNGFPNGVDINTANIRALFANEKLWSITGRAKKTYDDQTLAHFGFKVPHDVKHEISCFGHDTTQIHIGEVISTAGTSETPLGEIAGKGYAQQGVNPHTFTAPCHGVVMAVFSVVCKRNYEGGILKANCVTDATDLYQPEFDHLGMQPLFNYETNYFDYPTIHAQGDPCAILGWQYRYEQWKRRYNRVSGAFRNSTGALKTWIPSYMPYSGNYSGLGAQGKDDNLPNTNSFSAFINSPNDVNQIFLGQYPSQWSTAYESEKGWSHIYDFDPFVINGNIDCVLVSTMSDYSLPRLDA